jgi:hypothetical protein
MARTIQGDGAERLFGEFRIVCEALGYLEKDSGDPAMVSRIRAVRARGERALKEYSAPGYSAAVAPPPAALARVGETHAAPARERQRTREKARQRLFALCTPRMILQPANIVEVFLHRHPMWKSWDWSETEPVNTRMWPFVQGLDVDDPLPDDPRLALPLTVAGFILYRALHVNPEGKRRDHPDVVMDVYGEIAQGIGIIEKRFTDAAQRKVNGEVSEEFQENFAHTVSVAETLLLHAVRLGPDMWDLILRCVLGAGCKDGEPFYVSRPNDKGASHRACRLRKHRAKKAQGHETLKLVPKKK